MFFLQLSTSYISLSSVSFKIIDSNNLSSNLYLTNEDITLTLNDNSFTNFSLEQNTSDITLYKIIPNINFTISDNLYIQIKNSSFVSNKLKILFCQTLIDSKTTFPFDFSKYDPDKNSYIFTLTSINGIPFNLSTNPITVSNPIDPLISEIIPQYNIYNSGDVINVTIHLIDIYGNPVPDGLYEVELDYSDVV